MQNYRPPFCPWIMDLNATVVVRSLKRTSATCERRHTFFLGGEKRWIEGGTHVPTEKVADFVPRILVSNRIWFSITDFGEIIQFDEKSSIGLKPFAVAYVAPNRSKKAGIVPVVKQIDTLAAEYPAETNYLCLGQ